MKESAMTEFGKFLYELRKERGWTQETVADKAGVTNQAVSKWETGENYPETAVLLKLSLLFDVSVDELLKGKRNDAGIIEAAETSAASKSKFQFARLDGIVVLICAAAYLTVGFLRQAWHPAWLIFIYGFWLAVGFKEIDKVRSGVKSVWTALSSSVFLLLPAIYLTCGFVWGLWHPAWIVFIFGFLVCMIFSEVEKARGERGNDGTNGSFPEGEESHDE